MIGKIYDKALTTHELAAELLKTPDVPVKWVDVDYDYDSWYAWGVRGVAQSGELLYGDIIEGGDLETYFEED